MHRVRPLPLALAALTSLLALPPARAEPEAPAFPGVRVIDAFPGVTFEGPLGVVQGPGAEDLFVLEQVGRVERIAKWRGAGPVAPPTVFLDITAKVMPRMQGGLLGLAFHPQCAQNGRCFVVSLRDAAGGTFELVLSEMRVAGGVADATSERVILAIPKSTALHNGGWVLFGPDGKLYLSTGDNAKQQEALQTSQNPQSLLGKILRLDVDRADAGLPYAIPADNPWAAVAQGVRREIWAYGMRNPWRFSFDEQGNLWTSEPGTKGPGTHEWVTRVQRGQNHGWPYFEGTRPLEPIPPQLEAQARGFVRPVFEYERGPEPDQTAAWGGYVYRGSRIAALRGRYVWGDYPRGAVYTIDVSTGQGRDWRTLAKIPNVAAMGEDAQGELYFVSYDQGRIYTLVPGA